MPRDVTVKPTSLKKQKTAKSKSVIVHDTEKNGDPIRFNETMDLNTSQIATDNHHHHHTHHAPEKDAIVEDLSDEDVNRKSFSPEHLAFYINPESYFGEKQKHAPTVDAVSMTNVIHALYSPPPNKRVTTNVLPSTSVYIFDIITYSATYFHRIRPTREGELTTCSKETGGRGKKAGQKSDKKIRVCSPFHVIILHQEINSKVDIALVKRVWRKTLTSSPREI